MYKQEGKELCCKVRNPRNINLALGMRLHSDFQQIPIHIHIVRATRQLRPFLPYSPTPLLPYSPQQHCISSASPWPTSLAAVQMPRVPRSVPKKPGPYHAQPQPQSPAQHLIYNPPPPRTPRYQPNVAASSPLSSSPPQKPRWRTPFFALASTFAFGIAFYSSSLYMSSTRAHACSHPHPHNLSESLSSQKDVSSVYDQTASSFDAEVGFSEYLMGITRLRKKLARQCQGDVLEVSAGTGRNLGFYKFSSAAGKEGAVRSLTLVDLSSEMVEQSKRKWEVLSKGGKKALGVPVRFIVGDVRGRLPDPPVVETASAKADVKVVEKGDKDAATTTTTTTTEQNSVAPKQGYDTIIQTMGLCSTPSPVALLQNLATHLNKSNPDAKIILLEHGRSYYAWLNRILDSQAPQHADQHGCWWNRDIDEIVQQTGLEVVRERRKHFGTTWVFELKPKKDAAVGRKPQDVQTKEQSGAVDAASDDNNNKDTPANADAKNSTSSWIPKWT